MATPRIIPLRYEDEPLRVLVHRGRDIPLLRGIGSGLCRAPCGPPGAVWAVGDRGPNLPTTDRGVKILPAPDIAPALTELCVTADAVERVRTLPLRGRGGTALSGLPLPGEAGERAVTLGGTLLAGDPMGADTEALAVRRDGRFFVAEEYGPSILHVDASGCVQRRWVPEGTSARFAGADCEIVEALPALAARRRLNRGFEGLALSPDERLLYVVFQSALGGEVDPRACVLWTLDASTGARLATHVYRFDEPASFARDNARGAFGDGDLKLCELVCTGPARLLVLERGSATSRLYRVHLAPSSDAPLRKELLLDTDAHPEIGCDLEGVALLSPRSLLLVNDNDFGIDGARTRFWRVDFDGDL